MFDGGNAPMIQIVVWYLSGLVAFGVLKYGARYGSWYLCLTAASILPVMSVLLWWPGF